MVHVSSQLCNLVKGLRLDLVQGLDMIIHFLILLLFLLIDDVLLYDIRVVVLIIVMTHGMNSVSTGDYLPNPVIVG